MNDEWTPEELERLRTARAAVDPPRGLEEATVDALRTRGLVRPARRRPMALAALVAMAAALVVAVSWSVMHKPAAPDPAVASPRFVLLLYAGTDPVAGTPDTRRREYGQWARDLAATGAVISGEELSDDARDARAIPAAASGEAPGSLPRGFFVLSAPDLDAAERIAATCPHIRYGGRIVVKRIVS